MSMTFYIVGEMCTRTVIQLIILIRVLTVFMIKFKFN